MGRICLAGSLRVEADGAVYEGAGLGRPGRLVLAYLVHQRARPVGRDELAELCWGDELPRSWEQLVRGVAVKIRAAFTAVGWSGQDVLVTGFGGYQLRLPPGTVVDVEVAAVHLVAAGEALEAGEPEVAAKEAAQALEVAAAGFLPGAGGRWAEARAAELRELHLRALDLASAAATALEQWDEAADAAAAALAVEPYRESAHVALMVALAARGERVGALRAYERCRTVLAEELGVQPGPRAQAVYVELLTEEDEEPPPLSGGPAALDLPPILRQVAAGRFVGRDAELTALGAAMDRATRGERQVVLLAGEPGIGKTRLVAEFARVAHVAGARVLYGRADEDLGIPYAPVVEAIESFVAQAPVGEMASHVARHGGELARVVPGLAVRLPDVVPEPGEGGGDRHRILAAAADLVAGAARAAPVVLIADDLQWAAAPGLAMLRHLVRIGGSSPMVVIAAHRHPMAGSPLVDLLAQLGREPGVVRLSLEGLDETGVAQYLAVGDHPLAAVDQVSIRRVYAETGGNPFFVGELVRHLAQGRLGTPVGVVEMVRARLARRSSTCQQALAKAAVVGPTFSFDVLARVSTEDPDALVDSLDEAAEAAFVVEEDRAGSYQFVHAIVRDAIYDQLSGTRRARLHRAVGEALLASDAPQSVGRAAALAHHFCAAAPIGGGTEGASHALAAAYLAMTQYAWEDAVAHAQHGVKALAWDTQPDLELRYQLLIAIVRARFWTASTYHDETVKAGLAAAETARMLGSPGRMALAVCASLKHYWVDCADSKIARAVGREALEALGDDAPAVRAVLLAMLAMPAHGIVSEAESREALRLARASGDPVVLARVLVHICMVLEASGKPEEQLSLAEELVCLRGQATTAAFNPLVGGLRMRASARLQLGDRIGYAADRAALEQVGRGYRWGRAEVEAQADALLQHLLDGRFAEVEALLLEERLPEAGLPTNACRRGVPAYGEIGDALRRAHVARERGDTEDLSKLLVRLDFLRQKDRTVRALVARTLLELGDAEAARRELAALEAVGFDDLPDRAVTLAYLAEVAAELPDTVWATRLLPLLQRHEGQLVVARVGSVCPGAADRYIGQLTTVLGDWQDAERRFQAAATLEEHINAPPLLARTRWCHALMLHRRGHAGDRATAGQLLTSVLDITGRLGMAPLHKEAERLLGSLGR